MKPGLWKALLVLALLAATSAFLVPGDGRPDEPFLLADKLGHLVIFAVLALLTARAYPEHPRWGLFVGLVVYGAAVEIAQARVGRNPELLDLLADALGAALVFLSRATAGDARPEVRRASAGGEGRGEAGGEGRGEAGGEGRGEAGGGAQREE